MRHITPARNKEYCTCIREQLTLLRKIVVVVKAIPCCDLQELIDHINLQKKRSLMSTNNGVLSVSSRLG